MNLRDLQYLVALADHASFGRAAQATYVSQPTLSMQIKKLEQQLGITLIERHRKSCLLTSAGHLIVEQARDMLSAAKKIKDIAKFTCQSDAGVVKLGLIPTVGPYLLPYIVPKLTQEYPKLELHLVEAQTQLLLKKLDNGELDVAILALPIENTHLTQHILFEENFMLAVPSQHPLAQRKSVDNQDLEGQRLLLLEEGHCLRGQALALCQLIGAKEQLECRASSLETLRHMVAANVGITLLPELACRPNYANVNVICLPFAEAQPKRTVAMVWRNSSIKQLLLKKMANHISENVDSIN